jgi:hypothetical protein
MQTSAVISRLCREAKAVRAIRGESGALSTVQVTDDVSHHSRFLEKMMKARWTGLSWLLR